MSGIVVGVDGSEGSRRALAWALEEARRRGTRLRVVHAWAMPYVPASAGYAPIPEAPLYDAAREGGARLLEDALAAVEAGDVEVERVLVEGAAAESLIGAAREADLLVVGSRGRGGFAGVLLGSVGMQVAHHARVPVVIVPKGER